MDDLVAAIRRNDAASIEEIVSQHQDWKSWDEELDQPMIETAVKHDAEAALDALVRAGANINARDKRGRTPLHAAVERNSVNLVQALLRHGVRVNIGDEREQTPLTYAKRHDAIEIGRVLWDAGGRLYASNAKIVMRTPGLNPEQMSVLLIGNDGIVQDLDDALSAMKFQLSHYLDVTAVPASPDASVIDLLFVQLRAEDAVRGIARVAEMRARKVVILLENSAMARDATTLVSILKHRVDSVIVLDDPVFVKMRVKTVLENAWLCKKAAEAADASPKPSASDRAARVAAERRVEELQARQEEIEAELAQAKRGATQLCMRIMVLEGQKVRIRRQNNEQAKEMEELRKKVRVAMETPLQAVNRLLEELDNNNKVPEGFRASLRSAMHALGNNNGIYTPRLEDLDIEQMGKDWMLETFTRPGWSRRSSHAGMSVRSRGSNNTPGQQPLIQAATRMPKIESMSLLSTSTDATDTPPGGSTRANTPATAGSGKATDTGNNASGSSSGDGGSAGADGVPADAAEAAAASAEAAAAAAAAEVLTADDTRIVQNLDVMTQLLLRRDFDLFNHRESDLIDLIVAMFLSQKFHEQFGLSVPKLRRFALLIQAHYHQNPYHNFQHSFDVAHTVFQMMYLHGAAASLTPIAQFATLVAALAHDLDHPGVSNLWHVNNLSELAITYNDRSVLESHHCAQLFRLLRDESDANVLAALQPDDFAFVRKVIITVIMKTDMTTHFEAVTKLGAHFSAKHRFTPGDPVDELLLAPTLVHAADIGNPCKPWSQAKKWSDRVLAEFLNQGDRERERGQLISPYCDRNNSNQAAMSANFIDFVVGPLYIELQHFFPSFSTYVTTMQDNRMRWANLDESNPMPTVSAASSGTASTSNVASSSTTSSRKSAGGSGSGGAGGATGKSSQRRAGGGTAMRSASGTGSGIAASPSVTSPTAGPSSGRGKASSAHHKGGGSAMRRSKQSSVQRLSLNGTRSGTRLPRLD